MPDAAAFAVFLTAAVILALTPGPGIFYVLTRSLQGGRRVGLASAFGTALGGLVHVAAAALGLSALLAASAFAFSVVKYAGAAYLLYLGIRTLLQREAPPAAMAGPPAVARRAFYQGIATEVLNPKTALFFLAFIPQFINPHGLVIVQFLLLGSISVLLNTSADLVVVTLAGPIGQRLQTRPGCGAFSSGFRAICCWGWAPTARCPANGTDLRYRPQSRYKHPTASSIAWAAPQCG